MQAHSHGPEDVYRLQLVSGFCAAVEQRGYAATTIADIVKKARVSKRTFYEHFADKEECFRAAYAEMAQQAMAALAAAIDPAAPWHEQIRASIRAYVAVLDTRPALTRTFFLEVQAAGARALTLRRQILERFADQTRAFVELARQKEPSLRSLSPAMATALVGGINELLLLKVERGAELASVTDTATDLLAAVLAPALPTRPPRRRPPPRAKPR